MIKDYRTDEDIFTLWQAKYPGRVNRDGIVDVPGYTGARIQILFLLKEVNLQSDLDAFDLCEFCRNGARPQTWDNIARWSQGILQLEKDFTWAELSQGNEVRRLEYLKKICAVNVKKTAGGHTANNLLIAERVGSDSDLLRQQLDIYQPDIIVCCGTSSYYSMIYPETIQWMKTRRGVEYIHTPNRIAISFAHPEARVADNILFYALIDAVREISEIDISLQ
jgi:hypothetical protein